MQYHRVVLNSLFIPSHTGSAHVHPPPLEWDLRRAPHHAARVAGHPSTSQHLTQPATHHSVATLRVVSDLLAGDWVITAHNPNGVTVEDVLAAIYSALHAPLTQHEWECIPPTQRTRIEDVFYARCAASRDFDRTRHGGVLRIDCLLHTTVFAGLSSLMYRNSRWEVVLTLSRDFSGRARSHPEAQRTG
ncbi:hypothetical protein V8E55_007751 [Tylopilus felleus]